MIGIRRDEESLGRRVPLTPDHVAVLAQGQHLRVVVEPSEIRAFPESAYEEAGAAISPDLSQPCRVILGVQGGADRAALARQGVRVLRARREGRGKNANMPMLRRLMELGCTLVDYEKIADDRGGG